MDGEILDRKLASRMPLARRGDDVALYEIMLILERVLVLEIWPLRDIPADDRELLIVEARTRLLKRLLSRMRKFSAPIALAQQMATETIKRYNENGISTRANMTPESPYLREHLDRAIDLTHIDGEISSEQAHVAHLVAEGATYARIAQLLDCGPSEVETILLKATQDSDV